MRKRCRNVLTVGAVACVDQLRGLTDLVANFATLATASLILIVEDDRLSMTLLSDFLNAHGYTVLENFRGVGRDQSRSR